MTDVGALKWRSAVGECRIHESRLQVALSHVAEYTPLDGGKIERMRDEDAVWVDQLLYRFSKLQDAMGERVFVDGLFLLGEDFRDKPFLDALNRLEALTLIPGRDWWLELREYRNQVAHEYPDRRAEQAAAINAIFEKCAGLMSVFNTFVSEVELKVR
jgi:hypothetical protein